VGVTKAHSADDFLGVTVQPMADLDGYEIIFGSSVDPQFGPVLLFGTGGSLVELYEDRSLGLPPLTGTLARRLMARTKIYKALKGVRGRPPVDLVEMDRLLVRFSELIAHEPWIKELDINPLLASHKQIIALDARVVLHDPDTKEEDLPKLSVRPYPVEYVSSTKLKNNEEITIRPIRPEDERSMVEFHKGLSEQTVMNRYHKPLDLDQRIAHNRLHRVCFTDYARVLALVGCREKADGSGTEMLGVCRLRRLNNRPSVARLSVIVADSWQGVGLGRALLETGIKAAKEEGIKVIEAHILPGNTAGIELCRSMGGEVSEPDDLDRVHITLAI
jgi:acetyltransferase